MTANTGAALFAKHFSAYVLPGRTSDPGRVLMEANAAEAVGLGGVWISERYASKEPAVIAGTLAFASRLYGELQLVRLRQLIPS